MWKALPVCRNSRNWCSLDMWLRGAQPMWAVIVRSAIPPQWPEGAGAPVLSTVSCFPLASPPQLHNAVRNLKAYFLGYHQRGRVKGGVEECLEGKMVGWIDGWMGGKCIHSPNFWLTLCSSSQSSIEKREDVVVVLIQQKLEYLLHPWSIFSPSQSLLLKGDMRIVYQLRKWITWITWITARVVRASHRGR